MEISYTKILTDIELPDTFSGFIVLGDIENDLLIYCEGGLEPIYTEILVRDVIVYRSYEEFCHPDMDSVEDSPKPPFSNPDMKIYYPALEVKNSSWLDSFSEVRLLGREDTATHYKFLSYSNILDVISNSAPRAGATYTNNPLKYDR